LLHAGVVNLGGFVLIRLAALLSAAPAAQTLLVVVGSLTAVLAGLVMMTRISIKVRLAWSTCAQMGFMLMECGLGLYDLALLHLIAHSLYKAHAFLTAGEAVLDAGRRDLLPVEPARGSGLAARLTAAPLAIALVVASVVGWRTLVPDFEVSGVVVLILGFALAPLLWRPTSSPGSEWARGTMQVLAITQLYLLWHFVFAGLIHGPAPAVSMPLTAWVGLCFSALYIVQTWVLAFPEGSLSRALYPWAYAGFFLDERFTRVTFRIWPARLPARTPFTAAPIVSGEQA
jgi:NAD(P)H-quinone oxidoreductase subunit 5